MADVRRIVAEFAEAERAVAPDICAIARELGAVAEAQLYILRDTFRQAPLLEEWRLRRIAEEWGVKE